MRLTSAKMVRLRTIGKRWFSGVDGRPAGARGTREPDNASRAWT